MKSQCAILSEIQVQNFDDDHWRREEIKDQWWKHTFEILQPLFTIIPEWAFHFKMQAAEEPKRRASSTFFQLYNRKLLVNCIMQHGIKPHNLQSWFKGALKLDWIGFKVQKLVAVSLMTRCKITKCTYVLTCKPQKPFPSVIHRVELNVLRY